MVENDEARIAKPGIVAYAASYDTAVNNEPQYNTQKSKTFDYLNLGTTHDYYRGDAVKVGIIDSGINYDHEDFMVSGSTKVKGTSKYYSYQSSQWVYYGATQHGYTYIDDSLGHGTNVAATVAAAVNSVGGVGIAPNVELYVYKVTNASNGYEFGAVQLALSDAISLGLDVINMSFQSYEHEVSYGGSTMGASSGCSSILTYYLNQAHNAGITLVGAAGNYNTNEPSYPGSNNFVINVGSLSSDGTEKAPFSNYGSNIDLVAPGYVHVADKGSNNAYKDTQGTSFSAPLVTGAIALYIQKHPDATPSQIERALYESCDTIPNSSSWAGNGALNVEKFLGISDEQNIPVTGVSLDTHSLTLSLDEDATLVATVSPNDATNKAVAFSSSDEDVVMVDENTGYLLPVDIGTATITVTTDDGSFTDTCIVTITDTSVTETDLTSISLSGVSSTIPYKNTFDDSSVVVTAHYSDNSTKNVTENASTTSSIDTGILGNQTLTYSYTEKGITKTASLTIKVTNNGASSNVGESSGSSLVPQTPITWTFTSSAGAYSGGTSGTSWTVGGTVQGYEESRGIQWSKNAGSLSLTGFSSSYVITSIVVMCSANATSSTMSVTVGGDTFDTAQSIGNSNGQTKTFTNADGMSGAVVISTTKGSKSVYIKSVQISYSIEEQSGTSYPATPTDQAKAWSTYFLNNIKPSCNISGKNSNITAITSIWSELKNEFNYMVSASKTAFASNNDSTISEARQLYTLLVNKYQGLENYINGINNSAKTPLFVEINDKNIDLLIMLIGLLGLIGLGGYTFHTKRR